MLPEELHRIARAADAARALGAEHLVVGGGARRFDGTREADYDALAAGLDRVVEIARARGLAAHYHPHLSTIVETPEEARKVFARTSIGFCPDTAHLAAAGGDPAALVRAPAGRITEGPLKGGRRAPVAVTPVGVGARQSRAFVEREMAAL